MGSGIIHNLLKNGHDVAVFTRTKSKADPLFEEGAQWASSPAVRRANSTSGNSYYHGWFSTRCGRSLLW